MKYNEAAARITRVYPIRFGMKRNTISWLIRRVLSVIGAAEVASVVNTEESVDVVLADFGEEDEGLRPL
jgi:hypothetical protein